jgi:adenosylcobinamide-GDP ribazoletransferase
MRKNDTPVASPTDLAVALVLLTRLPVPALPQAYFKRQAHAVWAFPIAGVAIGICAAIVGSFALWLGLPIAICAGLILGVQIVISGAMHEDGLADCADGFWGGFDPTRRLEIMKDSAIGTYGVLALVLSIGLRWSALISVIPILGVTPVIAIAALSRAPMGVVMSALPNARGTGLSSSVGTPPALSALFGCGVALIVSALMLGFAETILLALILTAAASGFALLAKLKVGGQTGDVLGATQQVCEVVALLTLASISAG